MPDFEKMYYQLAASLADAVDCLIEAHRICENEYMQDELRQEKLMLLSETMRKNPKYRTSEGQYLPSD